MTLNYRLAALPSPLAFPIPIHDAATALRFIISPKSAHNRGRIPRLSLYGSHIGGLLATTLALTEPASIHALAVSEPIVDWVGLAQEDDGEFASKKPYQRKHGDRTQRPDPSRLLGLRSKFFRNAESYFDPFASPALFLRAPGRDCPNDSASDFLVSHRGSPPQPSGPYDNDINSSTITNTSSLGAQRPKRRKVLRRWPWNTIQPTVPPHTKIYTEDTPGGEAGLLRAQGAELVELMRRACFLGRERSFAEARIRLEELERSGENEVEGLIGVRQAASWLRKKSEE